MAAERTRPLPTPSFDPMTEYRVIQMKMDGASNNTIAAVMGLSLDSVVRIVAIAAKEAKAQRREIVDEKFMLSLLRLEKLHEKISERLNRYMDDWSKDGVVPVLYHDEVMDAVKLLLAINVRLANLLGLDANKTSSATKARDVHEWMNDPNVSEERLLESARRMGLRVPKAFDAPLPAPEVPS